MSALAYTGRITIHTQKKAQRQGQRQRERKQQRDRERESSKGRERESSKGRERKQQREGVKRERERKQQREGERKKKRERKQQRERERQRYREAETERHKHKCRHNVKRVCVRENDYFQRSNLIGREEREMGWCPCTFNGFLHRTIRGIHSLKRDFQASERKHSTLRGPQVEERGIAQPRKWGNKCERKTRGAIHMQGAHLDKRIVGTGIPVREAQRLNVDLHKEGQCVGNLVRK